MATPSHKPDKGDILVVIHDFQARSSDELSLSKGDRVELIERDDEFGDGWYLGRHIVNGNSGLFPEVYTRPAPKPTSASNAFLSSPKPQLATLTENANEHLPSTTSSPADIGTSTLPQDSHITPATLPLNSTKSPIVTSSLPPPYSTNSLPTMSGTTMGSLRLNSNTDSHVLHETLNVIDEHITDLNSPPSSKSLRNNDSGSEYSSHIDHRISYIQGEETDEEEDTSHSRREVEAWSADQVAEYLFTAGVEKHHCEVFRDQEITGEVLLGMDQTSLFIKAFDLGSVGRRLKTWQKIKNLQDEVNGEAPGTRRTTQTYGSEAGSDVTGKRRSRTNTVTSSNRYNSMESRSLSLNTKRQSETPKIEPAQPVSPVSPLIESPSQTFHNKRPSAASVRDLHHSRRHSSTDYRLGGQSLNSLNSSVSPITPKLTASGTFPQTDVAHKKQPSFDRNWTLGSATTYSARPLSSAGLQDTNNGPENELQDSAVDLDRGYFSGTDADPRRRNVLRKRDSTQHSIDSPKASYAEEQRVRSATALSRHSRFGSVDSVRDREPGAGASTAAQKYYGINSRRTVSTTTTDSIRPVPISKDATPPTVTKLGENSPEQARSSPKSAMKRLSQVNHPDFNNMSVSLKTGFGLRAASDAITGNEKAKVNSPMEASMKDSPMFSPSRTGSSTPSVGPSFELDSPDAAKSPSTATTQVSRGSRKKTKKETSAYTRGLQKITPREAIADADYSGWMKKRSANLMTTWKPRLFVLKGRRLAYYYSEDDEQEKGLIDISFHRVLPADNERLTGLHATLTGASSTPAVPAGSHVPTLAATEAEADPVKESDSMFIFKLVPPRAGLSRAVNFTKPTVHYFAVPNIKQGRLWMAALMKATIDRDDTQAITTTYQQKTISLAKARQMRHRPPALMNLDEAGDDGLDEKSGGAEKAEGNGLGIVYSAVDADATGIEKLGLRHDDTGRSRFGFGSEKPSAGSLPQSA
ncbi:protein BOI2 [Naviculisporaceae sp. PSN 640]